MITDHELLELEELLRVEQIEKAREDFFSFCNALSPNFYKKERQFLIDLCNELQEFYFSSDDVIVLNVPPRHGKSFIGGHLAQWIFVFNISEKYMTGFYNETLSTVFSKQVRNSIQEIKADHNKVVYSDIFPETSIKHGDGAMNLWSLEGDRKSTRLNSSHVAISYADFYLKKK